MPKDHDLLSARFAAEETEGWLDKVIADEDEPDRATIWRLGTWGVAAIVALSAGLLAGEMPINLTKAQLATAELADQGHRLEGLTLETQQEARRLAAAIDTLNKDRDRLFGRVSTLEQGLDSVTGSIAKQTAGPPLPAEVPTASDKSAETPPVQAPSVPAVAAETARAVEQQKAAADPQPAAATPPASPSSASTKKADRGEAPRAAAANTIEAKSEAHPDAKADDGRPAEVTVTTIAKQPPASVVTQAPLPPIVAALPPAEPIDDAVQAQVETPIGRTQFGLDLGGASSMTGLRAVWKGVRKSHGKQLGDLRPVLMVKEGKNGLGLQVHVIAGPIPDAAVAAKLCAVLTADDRNCETTIFDGQRLMPEVDEPTKKPASSSRPRRKQAHRAPPSDPVPPEPPSLLSSLLNRR